MSTQPTRRRLEAGVYERVDAAGERLGLEIAYKDADGRKRRRAVDGNVQAARDELAKARTRRVKREREPADPRVTFAAVADKFEAAHVAGLRPNSQEVYRSALRRLRQAFRARRLSSITREDLRRYVASERAEGLKANTINSHLSALSAIYTFARGDLDMSVSMPPLKPSERPQPADDQREHRVLADDELARVLEALEERVRLYFRTLAETGCRESEGLGLRPRSIGADTIAFREQLGRDGELAPLKTRQSRRTIEITRGLAAELALAADRRRVFELDHSDIDHAWRDAIKIARLSDPQPVIHDLRHTHVSALIADGWDPVEVAQRIGDTLATTLKVYAHAFDARRRGEQRRALLEARYGDGDGPKMATHTPPQTATNGVRERAETVDLRVERGRRREA